VRVQEKPSRTLVFTAELLSNRSIIERLRLITVPPEQGKKPMRLNDLKDKELLQLPKLIRADWSNARIAEVIRASWGHTVHTQEQLQREMKTFKRRWRVQQQEIDQEKELKNVTYEKQETVTESETQDEESDVEIGNERSLEGALPRRPKDLELKNVDAHSPARGLLFLLSIEIDRIMQFRRYEATHGVPQDALTDSINNAKSLEAQYLVAAIKEGIIVPADLPVAGTRKATRLGKALDDFHDLLSGNVDDAGKITSVVNRMKIQLESMTITTSPKQLESENAIEAEFTNSEQPEEAAAL
jgi:hypothetical protein